MKAAFRADASVDIGAGHVMRCLALADELRRRGAETRFLCREQPGDLCGLVAARGHAVHRLPVADARADAELSAGAAAGADWLVVDHYGLDAAWEAALRGQVRRILAIDDLGDRAHDCDLLLDQNLERPGAYAGLLPTPCRTLLGPRYALLRPEFARLREALPARRAEVGRILILFGGSDPLDLTGLALAALDRLERSDLAVDVVVGAGYPHQAALRARCAARPNTRLQIQAGEVAELMAAADLAIGATGATTWERACLGLPALAVTFADNQRPIAAAAQAAGMLAWLGDARAMSAASLAEALAGALAEALAAPQRLAAQRAACLARVDGGGCPRVAEAMAA